MRRQHNYTHNSPQNRNQNKNLVAIGGSEKRNQVSKNAKTQISIIPDSDSRFGNVVTVDLPLVQSRGMSPRVETYRRQIYKIRNEDAAKKIQQAFREFNSKGNSQPMLYQVHDFDRTSETDTLYMGQSDKNLVYPMDNKDSIHDPKIRLLEKRSLFQEKVIQRLESEVQKMRLEFSTEIGNLYSQLNTLKATGSQSQTKRAVNKVPLRALWRRWSRRLIPGSWKSLYINNWNGSFTTTCPRNETFESEETESPLLDRIVAFQYVVRKWIRKHRTVKSCPVPERAVTVNSDMFEWVDQQIQASSPKKATTDLHSETADFAFEVEESLSESSTSEVEDGDDDEVGSVFSGLESESNTPNDVPVLSVAPTKYTTKHRETKEASESPTGLLERRAKRHVKFLKVETTVSDPEESALPSSMKSRDHCTTPTGRSVDDWVERIDTNTGSIYYFNASNGECKWEAPKDFERRAGIQKLGSSDAIWIHILNPKNEVVMSYDWASRKSRWPSEGSASDDISAAPRHVLPSVFSQSPPPIKRLWNILRRRSTFLGSSQSWNRFQDPSTLHLFYEMKKEERYQWEQPDIWDELTMVSGRKSAVAESPAASEMKRKWSCIASTNGSCLFEYNWETGDVRKSLNANANMVDPSRLYILDDVDDPESQQNMLSGIQIYLWRVLKGYSDETGNVRGEWIEYFDDRTGIPFYRATAEDRWRWQVILPITGV